MFDLILMGFFEYICFLLFLQPSLHGTSVILAISHFALTRGTPQADPQFLGAALLGELSLPYTLICLCLLYTSPSPRDATLSRMPSSA